MQDVPVFGMGQTDGVREYAMPVIEALGNRLHASSYLTTAFLAALEACQDAMSDMLRGGYLPKLPESRALVSVLQTLAVGYTNTWGQTHLQTALTYMYSGGNVLLVSNHTSNADPLVLDKAVGRELHREAWSWLYIADPFANSYLLSLMVAAGFDRIPIAYPSHLELASNEARALWTQQNSTGLQALVNRVKEGSQCVVLYPEGGQGNGQLLPGDPATMEVARLLALHSPGNLLVLPCYVDSTKILPTVVNPAEICTYLERLKLDSATLQFGEPQFYPDLLPRTPLQGDALDQHLVGEVMRLIAQITPVGARGPYEKRKR